MKKISYILVGAGILLAIACGKDKPETTPSIKIKSLSSTYIPINGTLQMVIEFADKQGDVSDTLFVVRERLNTIGPVSGLRNTDTFYNMIPDFPERSRGEIILNYEYQNGLLDAQAAPSDGNGGYVPDSIRFRFALHDKGGHVSDTIATDQIVVERSN